MLHGDRCSSSRKATKINKTNFKKLIHWQSVKSGTAQHLSLSFRRQKTQTVREQISHWNQTWKFVAQNNNYYHFHLCVKHLSSEDLAGTEDELVHPARRVEPSWRQASARSKMWSANFFTRNHRCLWWFRWGEQCWENILRNGRLRPTLSSVDAVTAWFQRITKCL